MGGKTKRKTKRGRNLDQEVKTVTKKVQALELRKLGVSYQRIADALGYANASGAWKAVQAGLKSILREPAEEVRALELERLDLLFFGIFPKAKEGDPALIDRVLRIMERRSKLMGLDAPAKHTVTWQTEIIQLIANGQLNSIDVKEELGEDLARQLFESAGITFVEDRETEAEIDESGQSVAEEISE